MDKKYVHNDLLIDDSSCLLPDFTNEKELGESVKPKEVVDEFVPCGKSVHATMGSEDTLCQHYQVPQISVLNGYEIYGSLDDARHVLDYMLGRDVTLLKEQSHIKISYILDKGSRKYSVQSENGWKVKPLPWRDKTEVKFLKITNGIDKNFVHVLCLLKIGVVQHLGLNQISQDFLLTMFLIILLCIVFNRCGTLISAGCSVVWDFRTRGVGTVQYCCHNIAGQNLVTACLPLLFVALFFNVGCFMWDCGMRGVVIIFKEKNCVAAITRLTSGCCVRLAYHLRLAADKSLILWDVKRDKAAQVSLQQTLLQVLLHHDFSTPSTVVRCAGVEDKFFWNDDFS